MGSDDFGAIVKKGQNLAAVRRPGEGRLAVIKGGEISDLDNLVAGEDAVGQRKDINAVVLTKG